MSDDTITTIVPSTKPVDLDKLDKAQLCTAVHNLDSLGQRAREELSEIEKAETSVATRAVLFGCVLAQIRAGLEYGQFGSWMNEHFSTTKRRQCYYYISLAAKFARSKKLLLPELTSLPQLTLALEAPNKQAAAALAKVQSFVGERTLNELLVRHGIKKKGGDQRGEKRGAAESTDAAPAEDTPSLEEGAVQAFTNVFNAIDEAERVLLSETNWALLDVEKAEMLEGKLKSLAASFHERALRLRHDRAA